MTTSHNQSYSRNEIKQHNKEDDCWIIVKNKVYDVTPYLNEGIHPGGDEVLLKYGGKDATQSFTDIHSNDAWKILDKYYIGDLNDTSFISVLKNMLWY